jgi:hypothetical protein
MAAWREIEAEAPELAARAREAFDRHIHKTLATLRRDGAPRISGTEVRWAEGEMWLGSMPRAVKARDLQRDPRYALHSASSDEMEKGEPDAKVAGRAEEITDFDIRKAVLGRGFAVGGSHLFRCDITELVVTQVEDQQLVIRSWHEGRGTGEQRRD